MHLKYTVSIHIFNRSMISVIRTLGETVYPQEIMFLVASVTAVSVSADSLTLIALGYLGLPDVYGTGGNW